MSLLEQIALGESTFPVDVDGLRIRVVRYQAGQAFSRHAHATSSLALVLRGNVEEVAGECVTRAESGGWVIKPAGSWHATRFGPYGAATLQLEWPQARPLISDLLTRDGSAYRWGNDLQVAAALLQVYCAVRTPEARGSLQDSVLDALGALAAHVRRPPGCPPAWMCRVEKHIRERLEDALRVRDLALLAGVHPVHLARVFQHTHGCGVVEFVQRARVRAAAKCLAARRRSIGEIAAACGFFDQAHLTRVFRRELGITPARYRRLVAR